MITVPDSFEMLSRQTERIGVGANRCSLQASERCLFRHQTPQLLRLHNCEQYMYTYIQYACIACTHQDPWGMINGCRDSQPQCLRHGLQGAAAVQHVSCAEPSAGVGR